MIMASEIKIRPSLPALQSLRLLTFDFTVLWVGTRNRFDLSKQKN